MLGVHFLDDTPPFVAPVADAGGLYFGMAMYNDLVVGIFLGLARVVDEDVDDEEDDDEDDGVLPTSVGTFSCGLRLVTTLLGGTDFALNGFFGLDFVT